MTNIEDQNKHPLYKEAHERFLRAESVQNAKAAAKYPEPLNPASWTAEELADHAAEEAVDMLRYIEGLKQKCETLEIDKERLRIGLAASLSTLMVMGLKLPHGEMKDQTLDAAREIAIMSGKHSAKENGDSFANVLSQLETIVKKATDGV